MVTYTLCDEGEPLSLCLVGSRRRRPVVRAGITTRVPLAPTSAGGLRGAGQPPARGPYRSLPAAPPLARNAGPSSTPARASGAPRERKLGEGTTGWTGSGKGWRPPPTPAGAPRDGGGAGACLALPFLSACLEPQRLPTSRPPGLRGGDPYWGARPLRGRYNRGSAGRGGGGCSHQDTHTRRRKPEHTTTQHRSRGASNQPPRGGTRKHTHLCTQPKGVTRPPTTAKDTQPLPQSQGQLTRQQPFPGYLPNSRQA